MAASGKCLCGAVRFSAEQVETHIHACHCSTCRQWTGGAMLASRADGVVFDGEQHIKTYESSAWAERGFCVECGSTLFYRLKEPQMYVIAIGAFDDPDQFELTGEIYIDEKPKGYDFAGDHERLTGEEFMASMGASND